MGPNWPRRRYEIIVKKGGAPLGLKLHQTKSRSGVYANGFTEGSYPPPGPQACMRVGDVLVSVDGKNVQEATLSVALATIEAARRRDRLRDFISAKQDDPHRGNVVMVFERVSPRLTFRDVALDPRKVVYLLNYMLEVRCAGSSPSSGGGGTAGSSTGSGEGGGGGGGGGKKEPVIISLDEARLMFWLEVQVLFEMSAVMAPSRADMSNVYDKFFRPGSGFYVQELADKRQQPKLGTRRSWNGDVSDMHSVGRDSPPLAKDAKDGSGAAEPRTRSSSPTTVVDTDCSGGTSLSLGRGDSSENSLPCVEGGGRDGVGAATEAESSGGGSRGNVLVGPPKIRKGAGRSASRESGGKAAHDDDGLDTGDWNTLPMEFLAADLSKIFRASQEKVEETLTAGCFYLFKTSPWKGRMVAHLSNSPDFVHVPFAKIMAEQELRDVMLLHMMVGQTPGWLQVWREIELSVKPRLTLLQTRRSVRQQRGAPSSPRGSRGTLRRDSHSRSYPNSGDWTSSLSSSTGSSPSHKRFGSGSGGGGGGPTSINTYPTFARSSSSSSSSNGSSPQAVEAKTEAAVAILASAVYLWDFFLSADSHASLGLARDTSAYRTLKDLLEDNVPGVRAGGRAGGKGMTAEQGPRQGRDGRVDHAVSVGKALLDMQRHVLRKLCASVYPDFQASVCYEHLCSELTMGPRSPARLPPGPPDDADFDPPPHQDAAAAAAASGGGGGVPSSTSLAAMHAVRGTRGLSASSESTQSTTAGAGTVPSSPPRRAQAPPPLRQKMLQQQQQQMLHQQQQGGPGVRHGSGGGSGVGERSREKPRSPFAFLGGGSPPRDSPRERDRERVAWDGTRRSSAPGVSAGGTASRGPGTGVAASGRGGGLGSGGGGRVGGDSFGPEEDVPRPPAQGAARGGVGTVSGPQFDLLWRASRGWVLEKVMRRVELPPHVSRHRPPWDRVGQEQGQGHGGEGGEAGRGRKSSRRGTGPAVSPASPQLHEHLSLHHTTRRLGRRPYGIPGSPNCSSSVEAPTIPLDRGDSGGGASSHAGGNTTGDWELTSPPDVLTRRQNFGLVENRGSGSAFGGAREDNGGGRSGGLVEEEMRGCAEWAVTFSGSLDQGITTVKTEHAVCVAPRSLGLDVPPEGLEPFFCPCLPASGRGLCACSLVGGQESLLPGKVAVDRTDGGSDGGQGCSGAGFAPPPPRLFTFAAPGRSGAGIFYGACLSVFRPVSQWVGDAPITTAPGLDGRRSISPTPSSLSSTPDPPASEAPRPPLTAETPVLEARTPSDTTPEEEGGAGIIPGAEGTGVRDVAVAGAAARGGSPLSVTEGMVGGVPGVSAAAVQVETADDVRASGDVTRRTVLAEAQAALEGSDGGSDGVGVADGGGGAVSKLEEKEAVVIVEESTPEGTDEKASLESADSSGAVVAAVKESEDAKSLEKTPSMLELLIFKRGLGIFGKSSSGSQTKVSPILLSTATAAASSAMPSPGTVPTGDKAPSTDATPEADTNALAEMDGQTADRAAATPLEVVENAQEAGDELTPGGRNTGRPTVDATATSTTPSVLDIPTRFKMSIGMFGSGRSSPGRLNRGVKSGSSTAAAATTAATPSSMFSGEAGAAASTPRSSAGGAGKFSSYARRAGHFLGSDSRGMGRSPRLTPPLSPDVLPNGPPPPSPLVSSVFLASPPEETIETEPQVAGVGLSASAAGDGVAANSATSQGENPAGTGGRHKRSLSGVTMAALALAGAPDDSGGNSGTGAEVPKARSMSAVGLDSTGVDTGLAGSGSPGSGEGSGVGVGDDGGGGGKGGRGSRQKHDFFVSSGVCLISTRPEMGAMRRALASYWAAHRDEIMAGGGGGAAKGDAVRDGEESAAFAARESADGGDGGDSDGEAKVSVEDVGGEEGKEAEENVGAWTGTPPDKLRESLIPFVTQQRRRREDQRQSSGAAEEPTAGSRAAAAQRNPVPSTWGDGPGSGLDFDPLVVLRCLSARNLCLVVTALLCERKVVLVSSRLSLLTQAGEVFRSLLSPLSWSHVYVPLLPRRMAADLLQCPTPFILGLEAKTAKESELPKDAIQVHLDSDYLCVPKDFLGLAPMSILCARISSVLNPGVEDLDCPLGGGGGGGGAAAVGGTSAGGTADNIRFLFREFVSELLQGATESTFQVGQGSTATILLDEHLYKRAKATAAKTSEEFYVDKRRFSIGGGQGFGENKQELGPLYNRHCDLLLDQFVKTQMLSHFLSQGGWE